MHSMKSDLGTGIIEAEFIGFWEQDDVAAFTRDFDAHAARIEKTDQQHLLLVDYSRATIQAQAVVAALAESVRQPRHRSRRIAAFTTSGMAKLQAGRIAAVREDMAIFNDRASAIAWLREVVEPRYARVTPPPAARYVAH